MLAHQDIINKLTLQEKAMLTAGESEWQTRKIEGKVPNMFLSDGPFGLRKQSGAGDHLGLNGSELSTCFPSSATLANSWNPNVTESVGKALGVEASSLGVQQILGPALNTKRNPRGGRSFEYYSEDPYLAGKMAAGMIRGIQENGTVATPKHFAVNSQETRRMASNSVVDERALHELYLTNFEIAVKEGRPKSIMSSYNEINGIYANENVELLTNILRNEWGFKGYVVTDWGGDNDHIAGLKAGSNVTMPGLGMNSAQEVIDAVNSGNLKESVLDKRIDEFLDVLLVTLEEQKKNTKVDWPHQHQIAREAAKKSIVLLKNEDHILPLKPGKKVALIGDFAVSPRYQGAGSSLINAHELENLKDTAADYNVTISGYSKGYERTDKLNQTLIDDAVNVGKNSDVIVLSAGLIESSESEGLDRKKLDIPNNQQQLIHALATIGKPLVLVLSGGAVITMPWIGDVNALVHGYLGGEAGASAMWEVLTGKYNPSGRLAETYPMKETDIPFDNEFPEKRRNVNYKESIFVGYRYYETSDVPVLFPFGFGLSYTHFDYSVLKVNKNGLNVKVTNTGNREGIETVQLYVGKKDSALIRPKRELKGFKQVGLAPGESKLVTIPFDNYTFRFWDPDSHLWKVESGTYQIMIGRNAEDIVLTSEVSIDGLMVSVPQNEWYEKYRKADLKHITDQDFAKLYGSSLPINEENKEIGYNDPLMEMHHAKGWIGRMAAGWLKKKIDQSLAVGKPNLNFLFNYNMPFRAMNKMTGDLINSKMAHDILFIINGHFWRGTGRLIKDHFANQKAIKKSKWYPKEKQK
ncbi:glycoside hydrolase family 3 C-terminal domain-containing protein [Lactobacillus corticis]|uniref:Beta-glucosidase n=1 Tax=Lactobacillus corticis TaxID=2201249 RepID=A0A916QGV2_9LACO|nr:glycoside hydrolase family 3 C-terminal domain-containing protein [Lactobacillus corticis]GFZ27095.1 beta-glucosidase [Lactobacillus corticis]